ncbi:hypothetical protein [Enterococcus sp. HY326]|uniref:hypothetical protein n=1 Tax=Enterococcus sp. HY326 TaxID=2971265 RepID=UPI00223F45DD|nr:hypothetical protein [Enterococcus sp. HY326]
MKKRKWVILSIAGLILLLLGGGTFYWYNNIQLPHQEAISEFDAVKADREADNDQLTAAIDAAQTVLDSGEQPYDSETFTALELSIENATSAQNKIPELPDSTAEIITLSEQLATPYDYSEFLHDLKIKTTAANVSIIQLKQVTAPTEQFIVEKIAPLLATSMTSYQPVTETDDPNGNLNKPGGYTATIYFSSPLINQDEVYGNTLIEKGTEAGGAIEVYANVEDATKRNDYLAIFDGGPINSGSHNLYGTIVIRTSDKLTATQQQELEAEIANTLLAV